MKAQHWWEPAGTHRMVQDPRPGAPAYHAWWQGDQDQVGAYLHGYDSLWLPAALLQEGQRQRLVEALFRRQPPQGHRNCTSTRGSRALARGRSPRRWIRPPIRR